MDIDTNISTRSVVILGGLATAVVVASSVAWAFLGTPSLVLSTGMLLFVVLVFLTSRFRTLEKRIEASLARSQGQLMDDARVNYRQLEAFLNILLTAKPVVPLAATREWTASPDILKYISEALIQRKPRLVVEIGSGLSTLISAYYLRKLGCGAILSIDHDEGFASQTRAQLEMHGLADVAAVVHAPLTTIDLNGEKFLWYDLSKVEIAGPVDILFVDGPPGTLQTCARYPALPLLFKHLNNDALVILDDGGRPDEKTIVERWTREFDSFRTQYLDFERGAFCLTKQSGTHVENRAA